MENSVDNYLLRKIMSVREANRIALCGYFLVGYSNPEHFLQTVKSVKKLDIIELGIPSSNPIYDGELISKAHQLVINEMGIRSEASFALMSGLRGITCPKFVMTYAHEGRAFRGFLRKCIDNDIQGVFAPDIEPTEAAHVAMLAHSMNIAYVSLITTEMDSKTIVSRALISDIVYLKVSGGKTGQAFDFTDHLPKVQTIISLLRSIKPELIISIGIGIQRPEQVVALREMDIDMIIIGTKIMEQMNQGESFLNEFIESVHESTFIV